MNTFDDKEELVLFLSGTDKNKKAPNLVYNPRTAMFEILLKNGERYAFTPNTDPIKLED